MKKSIVMVAVVVVLACVSDARAWVEDFERYPDGELYYRPWNEGDPGAGGGQIVTTGAGYAGKGMVGNGLGHAWRAADPSTNVLTAKLYSDAVAVSRYYVGFHTEPTQASGFPDNDAVIIYMAWHTDGGWLCLESYDYNAGAFVAAEAACTSQSIGLLSNTWYDVRMTLNGDDTASGEYKLTTSGTWLPIGGGSVDILDPANFVPNFVGIAGQNSARIDDIVNGPPIVCNDSAASWVEPFESYPDGLLTDAPWDEGSLAHLGTEQIVVSGAGYTGKGMVGNGLGHAWRAAATDLCTNVLTARLYSEAANFSRYYVGFHTEPTQASGFPDNDSVIIYMAWHTDGGWLCLESYNYNAGAFVASDAACTGQAIGLLSNTWYDVRLTINFNTVSGEYKLTTSDTWLPIGDGSVDILDLADFAPNYVGIAGQNSGRVDDIVYGTPLPAPTGSLILVR